MVRMSVIMVKFPPSHSLTSI